VKLEGSLDAFGLPDIFQLLSYTKKTGGLHLRFGAVAGVVYFATGSVTGACADSRRQTLARRLVGTGAVDDGPLADAVARAKAGGVGVSRALLDSGAVDSDVLARAASEQVVDAVGDLLGWPEGDFSFSVDEANPDEVGVALATEAVVAAASAQREAAQRVLARIPNADVVLYMPIMPPDERSMSGDEWALVALADGRRSVGDIAELTGSGYVTVAAALADLTDRGLLELAGGNADHAGTVRRRLQMLAAVEVPAVPVDRRARSTNTAAADAPPTPARQAPATATPVPAAAASEPDPAAERRDPDPGADAPAMPQPQRATSFVPSSPQPVPVAQTRPTQVAQQNGPATQTEPAAAAAEFVATVGGPHVPEDVVPPRPEPFQPRRQPDHPEEVPAAPSRPAFEPARTVEAGRTMSGGGRDGVGGVSGSAALAANPQAAPVIERDPSVNRSLLLRLIAGVRGL
jgi:Domain of unknown function (DUF4388)